MAARVTGPGVAEPRQQRSRESFAKVRAAVLHILRERGAAHFSLNEVSALAGVSTGSIYGRVSGKAELLRVVQSEEFDRLDEETRTRLARAGRGAVDLRAALAEVVETYADVLREHRFVIGPFFLLGVADTDIYERGRRSGLAGKAAFVDAVRRVADEHGIDLAVAQADWLCEIVYSLSTDHLGFGAASAVTASDSAVWTRLVQQLSDTVFVLTTAKAPEK